MPARKKSLAKLVADRTFLARRHADLLEHEGLVDDLELRTLQVAFRAESSELERQALARRFERLVRTVKRDEPTLQQAFLASLGPSVALAGALPPGRLWRLEERWERWDARYGFAWRVQHDLMHNGDRIEAFRLLTGRRTPELNLHTIKKQMPDLAERARTELELPTPRDPPGWKYAA